MVEDPHGGEHAWYFLTVTVPTQGYNTVQDALAAGIMFRRDQVTSHRQGLQEMEERHRERDERDLKSIHPTLALTQPWSFSLTVNLRSVAESIDKWASYMTLVKIERQESDDTHVTYQVIPIRYEVAKILAKYKKREDADKVPAPSTLYLRATDNETTEAIFVPGGYHDHSAMVISSLYRRLEIIEEDNTLFDEDNMEQMNTEDYPLDPIFDAWYAERRAGKRITLKQWAVQANISYHWLSRNHKSYKQRKNAQDGGNKPQ